MFFVALSGIFVAPIMALMLCRAIFGLGDEST
jgi:hypothetical protein